MDRFQLRRDTSARWTQFNPVLLEGEIGIETDTKMRKVGDGTNTWNNLEYLAAENIAQELGDSETATISQKIITKEIDKANISAANGQSQARLIINIDSKIIGNPFNENYYCGIVLRKGEKVKLSLVNKVTDSTNVVLAFYTKEGEIPFMFWEDGTQEYVATKSIVIDYCTLTATNGSFYTGNLTIESGTVLRNKEYIDSLIQNEEANYIRDNLVHRLGKYPPTIISQTFHGAEFNSTLNQLRIPKGWSGENTTFENLVPNKYNNVTVAAVYKSNIPVDEIKKLFAITFLQVGQGVVTYSKILDLGNHTFVIWDTVTRDVNSVNLFLQRNSNSYSGEIIINLIDNYYWFNVPELEYSTIPNKDFIKRIIANEYEFQKEVIVNVNDYANLRECLSSINPSKSTQYKVLIPEGDYNLRNYFSEAEINNPYFVGLKIPDYVTLEGTGDRDKTILRWEVLDSETKVSTISTLNLSTVASLKNLTVRAKRIRYSVHDDYNQPGLESVRKIDNCYFIAYDTYYNSTYGSGLVGRGKWYFTNCIFENNSPTRTTLTRPFSNHNNVNIVDSSYIEFDNCRFKSTSTVFEIGLGSLNKGTTADSLICFKGSKLGDGGRIALYEESAEQFGAGIKFKVTGYANLFTNQDVIITNTDGVDYSNNVDLI